MATSQNPRHIEPKIDPSPKATDPDNQVGTDDVDGRSRSRSEARQEGVAGRGRRTTADEKATPTEEESADSARRISTDHNQGGDRPDEQGL